MDSALAPRTDGGRLQTSHERPGLGTLTPTPTSLTLGFPALEGGEVNRPTVGQQPWIEVLGEDRLSGARASPPREGDWVPLRCEDSAPQERKGSADCPLLTADC